METVTSHQLTRYSTLSWYSMMMSNQLPWYYSRQDTVSDKLYIFALGKWHWLLLATFTDELDKENILYGALFRVHPNYVDTDIWKHWPQCLKKHMYWFDKKQTHFSWNEKCWIYNPYMWYVLLNNTMHISIYILYIAHRLDKQVCIRKLPTRLYRENTRYIEHYTK